MGRNIRKVLALNKVGSKSIGCLDGIRVLSFVWIVFYHTFSACFTITNYNKDAMVDARFSWKYALITKGNLAVDSFLTMTGLLISHQFIQARLKK